MDTQHASIDIGGRVLLEGDLVVPDQALGMVVFAHGSGGGRLGRRNQYVARKLHHAGLGTLLFDLLTVEEERAEQYARHLRFDIQMLAGRMLGVRHWLRFQPAIAALPVGYFGASTGAAAALVAAAREPDGIRAVVSRGGRPDLAGHALRAVRAPTLLIVGANDRVVIDINKAALAELGAPARLELVARAGHLFEEPGALDRVALLARAWFRDHLWAAAEAGAHRPVG